MNSKTTLALIAASGFSIFSASAQTFTWNQPAAAGTYNWNDPANWTPDSGFPNAVGAVADMAIDYTGGSVGVNFAGNPTVGILYVGDTDGETTVRFTGGGGSTHLTLSTSSGNAQINKVGTGLVEFQRYLQITSNTTIHASAGSLNFGATRVFAGSGHVTFTGAGITTISGGILNDSLAYTGNMAVSSSGTLLLNTTVAPGGSGRLDVQDTGTLSGTGTAQRATTIHSGGTLGSELAMGTMAFSQGLVLSDDANFRFTLTTDTVAGRGTAFNGINVTGGTLAIQEGALFNLAFDAAGSSVDFSNSFWQSNQSWMVFENSVAPDVTAGIFVLGSVSEDAFGNSFAVAGGSFGFELEGNNIYLTYTAVPEPGTATFLMGTGLLAWVFKKRSRRPTRV